MSDVLLRSEEQSFLSRLRELNVLKDEVRAKRDYVLRNIASHRAAEVLRGEARGVWFECRGQSWVVSGVREACDGQALYTWDPKVTRATVSPASADTG